MPGSVETSPQRPFGRGGGNTIQRTPSTLLSAVLLVVVPALLSAHEVTHNGTVVALKTAKYAQPSGEPREVRELEVDVVDPKTKKMTNRVFTITDTTKITRAGKTVTTADVTARKDEKVARACFRRGWRLFQSSGV